MFTKGNCKMANTKYNNTKSDYELSFNNDAVIEICRDMDAPVVCVCVYVCEGVCV